MATMKIRWRTGDLDLWEINDQVDLDRLHQGMAAAFKSKDNIISFGTEAETGEETDYGFVWFHMDDVLWWQIDNQADTSRVTSWLGAPTE